MVTPKIIEGLTILQKYRTDPDGYHLGAEHDVLFAFATDEPVSEEDFNQLIKLGWFQPEVWEDAEDADSELNEKYEGYDKGESWSCYV